MAVLITKQIIAFSIYKKNQVVVQNVSTIRTFLSTRKTTKLKTFLIHTRLLLQASQPPCSIE